MIGKRALSAPAASSLCLAVGRGSGTVSKSWRVRDSEARFAGPRKTCYDDGRPQFRSAKYSATFYEPSKRAEKACR